MSKKVILLIVLGIFGVLCLLATCCLVVFGTGFFEINKKFEEVESQVVKPLCETKGDLSVSDYSDIFSENDVTYLTATVATAEVFSEDSNCSKFEGGNLFTSLTKGRSFDYSSQNGDESGTYTLKNDDDKTVTLDVEKSGDEWRIVDIEIEK